MELSEFGMRFSAGSGIGQLMEDLGNALAKGGRDMLMLGGGNPSHIPGVQSYFRKRMEDLLADGTEFERVIGNYDAPRGEGGFIRVLADLLRSTFGWNVTEKNIALTNGSQTAFFLLFNMFAGKFDNGRHKKILFPLTPEYIGYADLGLDPDIFVAHKPEIEFLDEKTFKYRVDFEGLEIGPEVGAICVSRPTNPTGNVITDCEVAKLKELADAHGIPLIVDNAYGTPFPQIIYTEANPSWDDSMVMCMSLSKLGLPGARTGIVIASGEISEAISNMNAVLSLAPGSLGVALAYDLVVSADIIRLSRDVIRPYYEAKAQRAYQQIVGELDGLDVFVHAPEGAMFLWLWMRGLPISDQELYERLKQRGVIVVPGHYFFPGLEEDWPHQSECIRVTYAQDDEVVRKGLSIICDEIGKAYRGR